MASMSVPPQAEPNASFPPNTPPPPAPAQGAPMPPLDPNAPQEFPRLPYSVDGKDGTISNEAAVGLAKQQAEAAELKKKHEAAAQILASPLNEKAKHDALSALYGPQAITAPSAPETPIDLTTPEGINNFSVDQYKGNIDSTGAIAKLGAQNARDTQRLSEAEIKARAPLDHEYAQFQQGQLEGLQRLEKEQSEKTQAVIAQYNQTNADMHKLAIEKPKDLFGQAGVNGILGRISMFLGGVGSNGAHENRNLAYIQDMANRNIAVQERNWSHLQAAGQSDQTLYGMIRNQTQDAHATASIMHNMYLSSYEAHLRDMGNAFASPRAKIAMNQELQKIGQQKLALDNSFAQQAIATGEKTLTSIGTNLAQQQNMQFKFAKEAHKEEIRQEEQGLPGFKGVATKDRHADLSKFQSGGYAITAGLGEIQRILTTTKGGRYDKARAISVLRAIITGSARQFFETGTRLEGPELTQMETVSTNYLEGILKLIEGGSTDVSGMISKLNLTKAEIRKATATKILGGQKGLSIDLSDPYWEGQNPLGEVKLGDKSDGSISEHSTNLLKALMPMRTINALTGGEEE